VAGALRGSWAIVKVRLVGVACFASYNIAHNNARLWKMHEFIIFEALHLNFRESQQITNKIAADKSARWLQN
jgi:hypothetical protein